MKTFFLAAAAALIAAAPAAAQEPAPLGTPDAFYFDCTGTLPLQTVDVETYSWSATAPTASYQEGAGCGWLDPGALQGTNQPNPLYDAAYGGSYAGEIKQLELTLFAPAINPLLSDKTIGLIVTVGGHEVVNLPEISAPLSTGPADQVGKYTWTIPELDIPASTRAKDIVISVATYYSDDIGGWLHGAAEVPAGVKFYSADDLPEPEPVEDEGEL